MYNVVYENLGEKSMKFKVNTLIHDDNFDSKDKISSAFLVNNPAPADVVDALYNDPYYGLKD